MFLFALVIGAAGLKIRHDADVKQQIVISAQRTINADVKNIRLRCVNAYRCRIYPLNYAYTVPLFLDGMDASLNNALEDYGYNHQNTQTPSHPIL